MSRRFHTAMKSISGRMLWPHRAAKGFPLGRPRPGRPSRLHFEPLEPRRLLAADSTVVFHEVMYHPPGGDQQLEWIELYNQMAADMDLSGWRLDGGVQYEFAQQTVLPSGEYLVVAVSPDQLQTHTGKNALPRESKRRKPASGWASCPWEKSIGWKMNQLLARWELWDSQIAELDKKIEARRHT